MTKKLLSKKARAFILFSQGKLARDPELKALKLGYGTRYAYYAEWRKKGEPVPSEVDPSTTARVALPGGEKIKALSEVPADESKGKKGKGQEEQPTSQTEPEDKVPTGGDGKRLPRVIAGEGLTVTINISIKTLALYQIARSMHDEELTLGDFVDVCVEDTYRGRGKDLGLVDIGGQ